MRVFGWPLVALVTGMAAQLALAELPLKCQQVFLWNKLEGYTQAEIAQKLGLTQSAVEKHMMTALKRLAEHSG